MALSLLCCHPPAIIETSDLKRCQRQQRSHSPLSFPFLWKKIIYYYYYFSCDVCAVVSSTLEQVIKCYASCYFMGIISCIWRMMFERNKMGINSSSYPIWKIEGIRREEWIIFEYDFALKWTMSGQFVVFKRSPPFMDPHIWPSEPSSSWAIVSISYVPPLSSKPRSNYIGLVTWIIFLHSNLSLTKSFDTFLNLSLLFSSMSSFTSQSLTNNQWLK